MIHSLRRLIAARDEIRHALLGLDDLTLTDYCSRGSRSAGRDGFPVTTISGGGSSSPGSTTESAALAGYSDDSEADNNRRAQDDSTGRLLADLFRIIANTMLYDARRLSDLQRAIAEEAPTPRANTVLLCSECDLPILDGGCHRVDGRPYHATSCYHRARRRRLGQNGSTEVAS